MRRIILKIWLLVFLFQVQTRFACIAQPAYYNFRHLTSAEGLSDGVVHAFAEDKYGFIWIGTSFGLNRFDGISVRSWFTKTGDSNSLIHNFIQSLFRDSKKNLWVGTYRGLCRY